MLSIEAQATANVLARQIQRLRGDVGLTDQPIKFGFATTYRTSQAASLLSVEGESILQQLLPLALHEWHIGSHRREVDILGDKVILMLSCTQPEER